MSLLVLGLVLVFVLYVVSLWWMDRRFLQSLRERAQRERRTIAGACCGRCHHHKPPHLKN